MTERPPEPSPSRDSKLPMLTIYIGFWALLGLFVTRTVFFFPGMPRTNWSVVVLGAAADWLLWAGFTPLILRLSRRFPITRRTWLVALPVHLVFAVLFTVAHAYGRLAMGRLVPGAPRESLVFVLYAQAQINVSTYWVMVGVGHFVQYYRRLRWREQDAARLEAQAARLETRLAQAQLDVLQARLHPHFLFNTLNAISAFIHVDPMKADRMLGQLAELLRLAMQREGAQRVPLGEELAFTSRYLDLQQIRLGPRLAVRTEIPDELLGAMVPSLVLQPLVENAVQHGIAARMEGGVLELSAGRDGEWVTIRVADRGSGGAATVATPGMGIGLANTRDRLRQMYGARHELELRPIEHGTEAVLRVPYETEASARSVPSVGQESSTAEAAGAVRSSALTRAGRTA